jgi:ElaB/YqjD/DUF883 family membrane-anchored ribosome-binding protein
MSNRLWAYESTTRSQPTAPATTTEGAKAELSKALQYVEDWVGDHPATAVGIALALGVTLGCLIKRR